MSARYRIIDHLTDAQTDQLMELYRREWWTAERRREDVVRMLAGSKPVVAMVDAASQQLIAFARVLTDYVYKALILDVIVSEDRRGSGLGKDLMDAILAHPALAGVQHFELYCRAEMGPFYGLWGFSKDLGDLQLMRWSRQP